MADVCYWLFLVASSISTSWEGPPTFLFLPYSWVEARHLDEGWRLVGGGNLADINGHEAPVECLKYVDEEWTVGKLKRLLLGRPYVVSLTVNRNELSTAEVMKTVARIRSGWDPKKKALFVVNFYGGR
jgi:hypothetical protein